MSRKEMIVVEDVKKSFVLPKERHTSAKQAAIGIFSRHDRMIQEVLKGISFTVYEGDFLGIVGKNGSGKSTLLKILAKIYKPNEGRVVINENISPFLELGVGFNPELSGWENIYLNGALLGLTKAEIDKDIDEIIEFSELRDFIDQKLKNYSSGMQVRLAFSVAIHAHAPIVLLDEVLAVGDANFQRKCQTKFIEMKKQNRTILLVTHDMKAVRKYCTRAILINDGKIHSSGSPEKVADDYDALNLTEIESGVALNSLGGKEVEIEKISVTSQGGSSQAEFGLDFDIDIYIKNNLKKSTYINCSIAINSEFGHCFDFSTYYDKKGFVLKPSKNRLKIKASIKKPNLLPGEYFITASLFGEKPGQYYHYLENAALLKISGDQRESGIVYLNHDWDHR